MELYLHSVRHNQERHLLCMEKLACKGVLSPVLLKTSYQLSKQAMTSVYTSRENGLVTTHTKGASDPDMFNERVFLRMSVYMIYCDNIYDLLAKSPKRVK